MFLDPKMCNNAFVDSVLGSCSWILGMERFVEGKAIKREFKKMERGLTLWGTSCFLALWKVDVLGLFAVIALWQCLVMEQLMSVLVCAVG